MSEENSTAVPPLEMTRVFDAPRAMVFEAWSTPEHVSQWFAPKPLTISACALEFHSGGRLTFTMRMENGTEFPFAGKYDEVIPGERIVFSGTIHDGVDVRTAVTFEDAPGGKTRLSLRQTYSKATDSARGANAGWTSTLENLAEHLER